MKAPLAWVVAPSLGILVAATVAVSSPARADLTDDEFRRLPDAFKRAIAQEMAEEAVACTAYFIEVAACMDRTPTPKARKGRDLYLRAAENAVQYAEFYAVIARMKSEAIALRVIERGFEMRGETNGNCANMVILRVKYADFCNEVIKDYQARMRHWYRTLKSQFRK